MIEQHMSYRLVFLLKNKLAQTNKQEVKINSRIWVKALKKLFSISDFMASFNLLKSLTISPSMDQVAL
jgi:hypothetical protein